MIEPPIQRAQPGYRVGDRYELIAPVASGGMAQVWRGLDLVLNRNVAVKILHPHLAGDRAFLVRFRREAVAAARLSHPSVVSIYDTVSSDGIEAIVMELIEGRTLREVLDERGALSLADAREVGIQVAEALAAAHHGGVIHRDIKPSNILLCSDRRVMVTDFGIAKAGEDTDLTVTGMLLGTAKYLSPEQVRGDAADARSDLYALGVVLYEALAGRPPFRAETDAATALVRLHEDPPPLLGFRPDAGEVLAKLVHRLLEREREDRFQRALDVRAALTNVVDLTVIDLLPAHGSSAVGATSLDPTVSDAATDPTSSASTTHPPDGRDRSAAALPPGYQADPEEVDGTDAVGMGRWLLPAFVMVLLGVGLVVAALLISKSPLARPGVDEVASSGRDGTALTDFEVIGPPAIASVRSFDPQGDQSENESLVGAAIDGDESTAWSTETYRRPNFGNLKSGVGLIVELAGPSEIAHLGLVTTSTDWRVEVYVFDEPVGDASTWGPPVGSAQHQGSDRVSIELRAEGPDGRPIGRYVLLWITDHGVSPGIGSDTGEPIRRFELAELSLD